MARKNQHLALRWVLTGMLLSASGITSGVSAADKTKGASKPAAGERAAVRVACEGRFADALVSLNGVVKGECPLDLEVTPGLIQIRAVKKRDDFYDAIFQQEFTLGSGVAKRIEVVFNRNAEYRNDAIARIDKEVDAAQLTLEARRREELPGLEASAAKGDAAAMTRLAMFCRAGLTGPVDMKKAVDWYRRGANAGGAEAMYEYARMLEWGNLLAKDMPSAVAFYKKSAALGHPDALNRLARFLEKGSDGFPKDEQLARTYYRQAAEGGSKISALLYWSTLPESEKDAGLDMSDKLSAIASRVQVQKAQGGEDQEAMLDAAGIYTYGVYGYDKNYGQALTYYRMVLRQKRKAAAAGDAETIFDLGRWSENAIGMPTDKAAALRYYRQAQQLGYGPATEALNKLLAAQAK